MNKSRAWRAIEKVAELNELVYALNRFGEKTGLNKGEYRSPAGIRAQPWRVEPIVAHEAEGRYGMRRKRK
jgi:hypothetical protein